MPGWYALQLQTSVKINPSENRGDFFVEKILLCVQNDKVVSPYKKKTSVHEHGGLFFRKLYRGSDRAVAAPIC